MEQTDKFNIRNKQLIIGGVTIGVLALGSFLVFRYIKQKKESGKKSLSSTSLGGRFKCTSKDYPLNFGTCHPDVALLQRYLINKGADLGSSGPNNDGVDEQFGKLTKQAAIKYLKSESFNKSFINAIKTKL